MTRPTGSLDPRNIINDTFAAKILRALSPGWGWCVNCGTPWSHVDSHTTEYRECRPGQTGRGTFPLCVNCWEALGAEAKLHAYRVHAEEVDSLDTWPEVAAALAAELGHTTPKTKEPT